MASWLKGLYIVLGFWMMNSSNALLQDSRCWEPKAMSPRCQTIMTIAQNLNLVSRTAPLGYCSIRWDSRQLLDKDFRPFPEAYNDFHKVISDRRLKNLAPHKRFLFLSKRTLKGATIPIGIRINEYYFILRAGLRGSKPFALVQGRERPLLKEIIADGEKRRGFVIPLTTVESTTPFPWADYAIREYCLPKAKDTHNDGPDLFYDALFFERVMIPKIDLSLRPLFSLKVQTFTRAGRLIDPEEMNAYTVKYLGEAGFLAVLLLQMLLAYDNKIIGKCRTEELRLLLEDLRNIRGSLKGSETVNILLRAHKLIGKYIPPGRVRSLQKPLKKLITMEPWLKNHIVFSKAWFHSADTRDIDLDGTVSMKLVPLQNINNSNFIEKSIIINDEHEFRLFAHIQYGLGAVQGVFVDRIGKYDRISLVKPDTTKVWSVISSQDSKAHLGRGVCFYKFHRRVSKGRQSLSKVGHD